MGRPEATFGLALLAVLLAAPGCHGNMYDPCSDIATAARGDAFVVGLALIPGGNVSDILSNLTTSFNPRGMCNSTYQRILIEQYGARVAVFNLKIDRLQVLRLPYPDIIFSITNALNSIPTMVVVAFRNNVASVPAYLANGSNDTTIKGAGFVTSLALLASFDKGIIQELLWYDLTCNSCGGKASQVCLQQVGVNSCAQPFNNCTCINQPANCSYSDKMFDKCSTTVNIGFSGTDVNDAAFRTGAQIKRLNAYSLTSLYYAAKDSFLTSYNNIYTNINGDWTALQEDSKSQQLDFGSSIGGQSQSNKGTGTPPPTPAPSPPKPPEAPPAPPPSPLAPGFGG